MSSPDFRVSYFTPKSFHVLRASLKREPKAEVQSAFVLSLPAIGIIPVIDPDRANGQFVAEPHADRETEIIQVGGFVIENVSCIHEQRPVERAGDRKIPLDVCDRVPRPAYRIA